MSRSGLLRRVFPPHSRRRRVAKSVAVRSGIYHPLAVDQYSIKRAFEDQELPLYTSAAVTNGPLFSIVVPVYNAPDKYLRPLVDSVLSQTYGNFELILVNVSTVPALRRQAVVQGERDTRIRVINAKNEGIAQSTNIGLREVKGDFVVFSDNDDLLTYDALEQLAVAIQRHPHADFLYSDEDKVSEDGTRYFEPHFKPDWSWQTVTSVNYITHLVALRTKLVKKIGELSPEKNGAQDYDYVLRAAHEAREIVHVPKVLYHWRVAQNSTASNFAIKPNITRAGRQALIDHFERQGVTGAQVTVVKGRPGFYTVRYAAPAAVSVVIPPFAATPMLEVWARALLQSTDFTDFTEVRLIVPKAITLPELPAQVRVLALETTAFWQAAARQVIGPVVVCNSIAFPRSTSWLSELTGLIRVYPDAVAAPIIISGTELVVDAGYVRGVDGVLVPLFRGEEFLPKSNYFGSVEWVRNVEAVGGKICVFSAENFKTFCRDVTSVYYDLVSAAVVDFSYTVSAAHGQAIVWTTVVFDDYVPLTSSGSTWFSPNLAIAGDVLLPARDEVRGVVELQAIIEQRRSRS